MRYFTNKNIVCISDNCWNGRWYRKQHFMYRFAKNNNRILYVEPTVSLVGKSPGNVTGNRFFKSALEKIDKNIFLLKLPRALPKRMNPTISKINHIWFAKTIDRITRTLDMTNYVLWIYSPEYFSALKYFNNKKLVFDLTDDKAAFHKQKGATYHFINECVCGLLEKSNLVIVTANTLFKQYRSKAKGKIFHIPNGVDFELFLKSRKDAPSELKNVKRPIIGFVGHLFIHLDYDLIDYIADRNKNWSIVLVGPIGWGINKYIQRLKKRNNIYFLGDKKKEEVPRYISQFNVCINPFRVDQVSRSVNPLKIYEYLAYGKPVVSVRMEALEDENISKAIGFANNYEEFVGKIQYWLENDSPDNERYRIEIVKNYSWDNLFLELNKICERFV